MASNSFLFKTVVALALITMGRGETSRQSATPALDSSRKTSGDWCSIISINRSRQEARFTRTRNSSFTEIELAPTLSLKKEPYLLSTRPRIWYDPAKGLRLTSDAPHADLWIGTRFQWRSDSLPGDINSTDSLQPPSGGDGDLSLRRGRIKGGGSIFSENIEIYSEYNFPTQALLDFRTTWKASDWLALRFGQWKSDFSRERTDSSGKQQFVDRSLANYWFTVDRQLGTSAYLRFGKGKAYDTSVWLQYLSGRGRGAGYQSGSGLLLTRWQWNPQGREMAFSQADLTRTDEFTSAVAFATIYGDTPFTRFSGSGGGQLPGYSFGDYRIRQALFETAAKWRGWSWQQELHVKEIEDQASGSTQTLVGGYAQIGTFPSEYCSWSPEPLELAMRYAHINPDTSISNNHQKAFSLGVNWYFNGHRNKLSGDVAFIDIEDASGGDSEVRYRLQWELSF